MNGSRSRSSDWLASGVVQLTGRRDGRPLVPPGSAATYARTLTEYLSDATAHTRHHVALDGPELLGERAAFTSGKRQGSISVGGACRLLRSVDGWVAVSCAREDDASLLAALISADVSGDIWPSLTAWVGEHSGAEFTERATLLGIAGGAVDAEAAHASLPDPLPTPLVPRSVEGMLVVDFSALWAGPLCAHLLGLAGARVVKVETPTRPDGARSGDRQFYRLLHAGHRSVVLDPSTSAGRQALERLVDAADVVIEASRPRALASFGLDAEASAAGGTTWISITAHGRDSDRVGFGDDIAASSGLVASDCGGTPLFVGDALADPLAGLTAAAMASSVSPTGGGYLWDLSMSAVVASTLDGSPSRACTPSEAPAQPRRRTTIGDAPASGADTELVLRGLGIELP
ncbi:CoA transferase [Rhodococcus sp. NPDC079359]|uniref:CoA transferase n=1 Tax=Rhodococcus sp. NPDC079359 TaxID=3154961 RepID=UPI0034510A47